VTKERDFLKDAGRRTLPGNHRTVTSVIQRLPQNGVPSPTDVPLFFEGVCQWHYDWQDREPSPRAQDMPAPDKAIREIHEDSRSAIGAPRMHEDLLFEGETWPA